jgi:hypothetical protein
MTSSQILIAHAVKVLVLLTLAGILTRRRARLCWSFVAYLGVILIGNSLVSFWPDRFFDAWFWMLQHAFYDALRMAIAVELAYRTFQAFPAAQATARRVLFGLLVITSLALMGLPKGMSGGSPTLYGTALLEWQPRVLMGTAWLMNALALLVIWYRVPLHAYHRAILLGFVPYLIVFTTLLRMLDRYGWDVLPLVQAAEPAAYMLLVAWWAYAAWQPEAAADVSPAVLRKLQPWRART